MSDLIRVFVVDDLEVNTLLMQRMLPDSDYVVETENNPKNVITRIKENKPDIMFIDVVMPEIDGFDLVKKIRAYNEFKEIPIIMFSSLSYEQIIYKVYRCGANDFLMKPIWKISLLQKIKKWYKVTYKVEL